MVDTQANLSERCTRDVVAWVAAATAAGAAAIHFSIIAGHFQEYWLFGTFFVVTAWLQVAFAFAVLYRPRRWLFVTGAFGSAAIVALYVVSRATGLPIGPTPWHSEPAAAIDVVCTVFEVTTAVATGLLVRASFGQRQLRRVAFTAATAVTVIAVIASTSTALASAVPEMAMSASPALATSHSDGNGMGMSDAEMAAMGKSSRTQAPSMSSMSSPGAATSGAGGAAEMATMGSANVGNSQMSSMSTATPGGTTAPMGTMASNGAPSSMSSMPSSTPATSATMPPMGGAPGGTTSTTMPGMGGGPDGSGSFSLATASAAGPIVWPVAMGAMEGGMQMVTPSCTTSPTSSQRDAAVQLVNTTVAATRKYTSLAAAKADGYVPITPTGRPVVHYAKVADMKDADTLDPNAIESLVYANTAHGAVLVAAMYTLALDQVGQMPPMPGGCLTEWHIHTNLCFSNTTGAVVGVTRNGACAAGSTNHVTQPMLHVWLAPIAGGPLTVDAANAAVVQAASRLPALNPPNAQA